MCGLTPPKPMAETPARTVLSEGHNAGSRGTYIAESASRGCGSVWPVAGGITWWGTASVALIRPATPAAALGWPMLPLIVLRAAGAAVGEAARRGGGEGAELGGVPRPPA